MLMESSLSSRDTAVAPAAVAATGPTVADLDFQDRILPHVSRTFALTIPQLPEALQRVIANAYLLCRIADTIEDEPALSREQKLHYSRRYVACVAGTAPPERLAQELAPLLTGSTLAAERELVAGLPSLLRITWSFNSRQRRALEQCVEIMCRGMACFQMNQSLQGLPDLPALDSYCYHVAGVVGEMLTELFCDYSPEIDACRERLHLLGISFGQGLQMTNILKDIWEDRARGACWLPRAVFAEAGFDPGDLQPGRNGPAFRQGLSRLIGIAHAHLRNALEYSLLMPPGETGIRRFCLWALGMAVLTLQRVHRHPDFASGREVKISRRAVRLTVAATSAAVRSDRALRLMFATAARGLPLHPVQMVPAATLQQPCLHRL